MQSRKKFVVKAIGMASLVAGQMLVAASMANAQTETVIHTFQSNKNDGAGTTSGLVSNGRGALYGTTAIGGKYGEGAVYKFSPPTVEGGPWTESIIYSFTGGADGRTPTGNLFIDPHSQHMFGTAPLGGANGYGVVFELTPGSPWTETVLYSFKENPDGATPQYGVVVDNKGVVYGTAAGGSARGYGVIFRLEPPSGSGAWMESILYRFTGGSDGAYPFAGVVLDSTHSVYGTTYDYQSSSAGTVFRLSPPAGSGPWTLTTLYSFTGGTDGKGPSGGLIFDAAGSLYGTTQSGGDPTCTANRAASCGTAFKLTPPSGGVGAWTESVLYAFTGGTDGGQPSAKLIFDSTGALYSTTLAGGDLTTACGTYGAGNNPVGCGSVFKLTPSSGSAWTESVLYAFAGPPNGPSDGASPVTPLVFVGGNLFGTTAWGGYPFGDDGEVFEVTP